MDSTVGIAEALLAGRMRLSCERHEDIGTWTLELEATSVALTRRELSVLAAAEGGAPNKRVALEQSVTDSTVSDALRTGLDKLGFASRTEFVRVMAGLRHHATRLRRPDPPIGVDGKRIVLCMPQALDPRLTRAERQVVSGVLRGDTNLAIAAARRTSARTVANQLAGIYRKLGVSSRWELAARLSVSNQPERMPAS